MNEHQRNTRIQNNSPLLHLQDAVAWVLENTSRIVSAFQDIFQEGDKLTFYSCGTPGAAGGPLLFSARGQSSYCPFYTILLEGTQGHCITVLIQWKMTGQMRASETPSLMARSHHS